MLCACIVSVCAGSVQLQRLKLLVFGGLDFVSQSLISSIAANPNTSSKMAAVLARRILDKSVANESPNAVVGETFRLYIDVLIESGDFAAALDRLKDLEAKRTTDVANAEAALASADIPAIAATDDSNSDASSTTSRHDLDADGARAGMLSLAEIANLQAHCHEKLFQFKQAQELHMRHLETVDADAWDRYEGLIRCSVTPGFGEGADTAEVLPEGEQLSGEDVLAFIRKRQSTTLADDGRKVLRGPFLAEVHFFFEALVSKGRLSVTPAGIANEGSKVSGASEGSEVAARTSLETAFVDALVGYFDRFGYKFCCFDDISTYVRAAGPSETPLLSDSSIARLQATTEAWVAANTADGAAIEALALRLASPETSDGDNDQAELGAHKRKLCRYICARKVRRSMGLPLSAATDIEDMRQNLVTSLVQQYETTLPLNGGGVGGQREVQVGDDLILLAAHYLIDMATATEANASEPPNSPRTIGGSWTNVRAQQLRLNALELLEIGHRQSPHNFQMRLLLVRLYNSFAALPRSLELFELFDVKHVQLDTLTQLILPALWRHGFEQSATRWSEAVCAFHDRADREMGQYVCASHCFLAITIRGR